MVRLNLAIALASGVGMGVNGREVDLGTVLELYNNFVNNPGFRPPVTETELLAFKALCETSYEVKTPSPVTDESEPCVVIDVPMNHSVYAKIAAKVSNSALKLRGDAAGLVLVEEEESADNVESTVNGLLENRGWNLEVLPEVKDLVKASSKYLLVVHKGIPKPGSGSSQNLIGALNRFINTNRQNIKTSADTVDYDSIVAKLNSVIESAREQVEIRFKNPIEAVVMKAMIQCEMIVEGAVYKASNADRSLVRTGLLYKLNWSDDKVQNAVFNCLRISKDMKEYEISIPSDESTNRQISAHDIAENMGQENQNINQGDNEDDIPDMIEGQTSLEQGVKSSDEWQQENPLILNMVPETIEKDESETQEELVVKEETKNQNKNSEYENDGELNRRDFVAKDDVEYLKVKRDDDVKHSEMAESLFIGGRKKIVDRETVGFGDSDQGEEMKEENIDLIDVNVPITNTEGGKILETDKPKKSKKSKTNAGSGNAVSPIKEYVWKVDKGDGEKVMRSDLLKSLDKFIMENNKELKSSSAPLVSLENVVSKFNGIYESKGRKPTVTFSHPIEALVMRGIIECEKTQTLYSLNGETSAPAQAAINNGVLYRLNWGENSVREELRKCIGGKVPDIKFALTSQTENKIVESAIQNDDAVRDANLQETMREIEEMSKEDLTVKLSDSMSDLNGRDDLTDLKEKAASGDEETKEELVNASDSDNNQGILIPVKDGSDKTMKRITVAVDDSDISRVKKDDGIEYHGKAGILIRANQEIPTKTKESPEEVTTEIDGNNNIIDIENREGMPNPVVIPNNLNVIEEKLDETANDSPNRETEGGVETALITGGGNSNELIEQNTNTHQNGQKKNRKRNKKDQKTVTVESGHRAIWKADRGSSGDTVNIKNIIKSMNSWITKQYPIPADYIEKFATVDVTKVSQILYDIVMTEGRNVEINLTERPYMVYIIRALLECQVPYLLVSTTPLFSDKDLSVKKIEETLRTKLTDWNVQYCITRSEDMKTLRKRGLDVLPSGLWTTSWNPYASSQNAITK